ncbi:serine O-acetyltransferase [Kaistia dalseonensis]|uniref:Serine acetyltransferase n=1 Tax=Kaistia dalseonensis TaxID=410840 RepID=A0ABU0HBB0_9HYPH|nr:serine O-acetyltransferase [Kaistia dalseonensis]MCX5496935.1 serine O-acetyltransferase [Kaistia dalseonensis]MDQ0439560.1 serine O-acetyltransferase [Kaistia dalseonensis]
MSVANSRFGAEGLASFDPLWSALRSEAEEIMRAEPAMASLVYGSILSHDRLEEAVAHRIADRLNHRDLSGEIIRQAFAEAFVTEPGIAHAIRVDIQAVLDRDPACNRAVEPVLYFKGFHAIQTHRLAHWLWHHGRRDFAYYLQSRSSSVFQVDINPAVKIGKGLFFDHATDIVIGETAVIEDNVSILQGVTLGGTGKETGDRHPKVRHGVLIGAGAKILGNIEIGHCSRVAAGSVVLHAVPSNTTVAGVPAKVVGKAPCAEPSRAMDQIVENQV